MTNGGPRPGFSCGSLCSRSESLTVVSVACHCLVHGSSELTARQSDLWCGSSRRPPRPSNGQCPSLARWILQQRHELSPQWFVQNLSESQPSPGASSSNSGTCASTVLRTSRYKDFGQRSTSFGPNSIRRIRWHVFDRWCSIENWCCECKKS